MVTLIQREIIFIGYIDTKGVNLLCFVEHCIITFSPRDGVINEFQGFVLLAALYEFSLYYINSPLQYP